jgi:hypothetical protein
VLNATDGTTPVVLVVDGPAVELVDVELALAVEWVSELEVPEETVVVVVPVVDELSVVPDEDEPPESAK